MINKIFFVTFLQILFFAFRLQYLSQPSPAQSKPHSAQAKQSQCPGVFLHFLKAIFFAKIEVNNHHYANQYHQYKSCLRRYSAPPVSECEIYQQRLEQNIYGCQKSFFSFFSPHLHIFCILNMQDFTKKEPRRFGSCFKYQMFLYHFLLCQSHPKDMPLPGRLHLHHTFHKHFSAFPTLSRIHPADFSVFRNHFQMHTMKSQQGR